MQVTYLARHSNLTEPHTIWLPGQGAAWALTAGDSLSQQTCCKLKRTPAQVRNADCNMVGLSTATPCDTIRPTPAVAVVLSLAHHFLHPIHVL